MKYCLFIDESGDFESQNGEWLISGFLCAGNFDEINLPLTKVCEKLAKDVSLGSIKKFHLTKFRQEFGHKEAAIIATKLIQSLERLPFKYHLLAAINHSKIRINDREKTYRLMLFDLIALVETVLPEHETLEGLEIVVATRTINGIRQTNASDIKEGIFNLLPQSLEVDLATKGLVDLIGNKISIRLEYANNLWGLVIADFIANLNYHKNRKTENALLNSLNNQRIFNSFDSFRSHGERRAAVAERDRDYAMACVRWLILLNETTSTVAKQGVQRSFIALTSTLGTSGSKIAFEALLDRIYRLCKPRSDNDYFISLTILLKESIQNLRAKNATDLEIYLYRTNVLLLKVVNHTGNTPLAMDLLTEQAKLIEYIVFDPDNLPIILEQSLVESEIFFNDLNHKEALERASKCLRLAENYTSVASLILDDNPEFDKYQSSIYTKAKTNFLRHAVSNNDNTVDLERLLGDLIELENNTNEQEKSRIRTIKTHLLLKSNRFEDAINIASKSIIGIHSDFDKISFIRSLSTAWLTGISPSLQQKEHVRLLSKIDLKNHSHPKELFYRELSIWHYLEDKPKLSLKYAKASRNSRSSSNARISEYLTNENMFLVDVYKSKYDKNNNYFDEFGFNTREHSNALDAMRKLLRFSPF